MEDVLMRLVATLLERCTALDAFDICVGSLRWAVDKECETEDPDGQMTDAQWQVITLALIIRMMMIVIRDYCLPTGVLSYFDIND